MSKIETVQRLASASNQMRVEDLARQIENLRQARTQSVDELARALEPLAQSMASLSDDLRVQIEATNQAAVKQATSWAEQQKAAAGSMSEAAKQARHSLGQLRHTGRRTWLAMAAVGLATGTLGAGLAIWLRPSTPIALDAAAVAQLLTQKGALTCSIAPVQR